MVLRTPEQYQQLARYADLIAELTLKVCSERQTDGNPVPVFYRELYPHVYAVLLADVLRMDDARA
jgi:hypothetical protein